MVALLLLGHQLDDCSGSNLHNKRFSSYHFSNNRQHFGPVIIRFQPEVVRGGQSATSDGVYQ